jgi:hypothetical protein
MTGDAMVRGRDVGDVAAFRARHVAAGAIIVGASRQPDGRRQLATLIRVAFLAPLPVISHALFGRGELVRVMARDTAQPSFAGAEAAALVHLLDLADETR